MSLTGKAIKYLKKTYPNIDFLNNVILRDDGNGPYIFYWGIGQPQPTEAEINAAAESMQELPPMPSDHELLMLLYADKKAIPPTNTFEEAIDAALGN